MLAHEEWMKKQKPEEILRPEEYDKKYGTNTSKQIPRPFKIEVLKTPSKNDPQFNDSGMCKFHNIEIAESVEGMVCANLRIKDRIVFDNFQTMLLKKIEPNYLYHWIYKTKLPKKPFIVHRTDTGYVLIREKKIK